MADQGRRWREQTASDEALARTLAEVGPLMRRQERAQLEEPEPAVAQPDPAFERTLRASLTGEEPATADSRHMRHPHAPADDDTHPTRMAAWMRRRGRSMVWVGVAAAVLAALLITVALVSVGPMRTVAAVLAAAAIAVVVAIRIRLGQ